MASIIPVDGKWKAMIRKAGHKSQSKRFATKAAAVLWARQVESKIEQGLVEPEHKTLTVSELIKAYRQLREEGRPISDSSNEHYMLKALDAGLGSKSAWKLTTDDLVQFGTMRKEEGAGPYTLNMDISKLGTVYRYGGAKLKISLPDVVGTARPTLTYLRLIGGGGKRERRPTEDEFTRLVDYFTVTYGPRFTDALRLAPRTALRRGELTEMKWVDIDDKTKMLSCLRKHPRKGKVLEKVPLLPEAWKIIQAQPKDSERVFPFSGSTLSKYFTNACRALSIVDLHFHDLRHEGASSLFEEGYTIEQVALVTGHKDWKNLKRYTNLKPESVHKIKLPTP